MDKRISSVDELHMTRAIEKAATMAVADDKRDRNELLAEHLLKANVDSRFAKTASMAFNKRLTVLKFQQTPDEDRPKSFALADPDTVFAKMGGAEQKEQEKTASVQPGVFSIGLAEPPMRKAASAPAPKPRQLYEDRVRIEIFNRHLESLMEKQAHALPHLRHEVEDMKVRLELDKQAVADELNKLSDFHYSLMDAVYGEPLSSVLKGRLKERSFTKQAGVCKPDTALTRKIDKLLADEKEYVYRNNELVDYEGGLRELAKSASAWGDDMAKLAFIPATIGTLLRGGSAATMTALQGAEAVRRASNDALAAGFGNAAALSAAGDKSFSPGDVLDAEFLTKDRFRDRLMGWSDMSADPLFSIYPSEQVFRATQKAMDLDPALERPDKREMLRTTVGKLLAQNNRASDADIAAVANTLNSLQGADKPAPQEASEKALEMESVKAPEKPADLKGLFELVNNPEALDTGKDYLTPASSQSAKELEAAFKAMAEAEGNKRDGTLKVMDSFSKWTKDKNLHPVVDQDGRVMYALSNAPNAPQLPPHLVMQSFLASQQLAAQHA